MTTSFLIMYPHDTLFISFVKLFLWTPYALESMKIPLEAKIKSEMQRTGLDLKSLCEKEGIKYHNFRKKVVTITGKGIKEFGL